MNSVASPSLAAMGGEVIRAILAQRAEGIFHCCGSDAVSRRELAEATVAMLRARSPLLRFGPAPREAFAGQRIPHDTSISATATSERLGVPLLSIDEILQAYRTERADRDARPVTAQHHGAMIATCHTSPPIPIAQLSTAGAQPAGIPRAATSASWAPLPPTSSWSTAAPRGDA